jgi:hypothetical protein
MYASLDAQRWFVSQNQGVERVVGLLDLPDVTGNYDDDACRLRASVQLYTNPSRSARAAGAVYKRNHPEYGCGLVFKRTGASSEEELPSEESGYEIAAAVVYERRGRWLRIAVPRGSAWIERDNANDFLPYPQVLAGKMAYLRNDWDGQLRQTASVRSAAHDLSAGWKKQVSKEIGVEIVGMTRVGSDDWVHVRFVTEGCVNDTVKRLQPAQGWLPAYRPDGTTALWFYSRGC